MRNRRDELNALIATRPQEPDPAVLAATRDQVNEIINDGSVPERKAMCDALIEEVRLDIPGTATPVFRVPFTSAGNPCSQPSPWQTAREREEFASVDLGWS